MCGIAGIVSANGRQDPSVLRVMVDRLTHRGPDDHGTFVEGPAALGMRRLSIIDVACGRQPIFSEDGRYVIVLNGEIYNFPELRARLEAKGHRFATKSDTEVIVHLYEDKGAACLDELRGMFAFAIWDRQEQSLFVARDRLGIKPLYFAWDGRRLLFGSEIKAVLSHPGFERELDLEAVDQFFTFLYVPGDWTIFRGVRKLLPAHYLTLKNGHLRIERYWALPDATGAGRRSEADYLEEFEALFTETIKGHLLGEVPLGAFLSGGVDSSLVVGFMSQALDRPVHTFSIGYDETGAEFDERRFAARAAAHLGAQHTEFVLGPDIVEQVLPAALQAFDEPFGDASVVPNYFLCANARRAVTVALTGLGGDELCGGYERYLGAKMGEYYKRLPASLRTHVIGRAVASLPDSATGAHWPGRVKRFVEHAALPAQDRYLNFVSKFTATERARLFGPDLARAMAAERPYRLYKALWDSGPADGWLGRLLRVDMETYLVDDLLALSDRTSMAHSLELRVPFLDHRVVEFFWRVPDSLKIKGLVKKYLLKKAAERRVPRDIVYRKKKGFSVPLPVWFRGSLKPYLHDMLGEASVKRVGLLDATYVRQLLDEHTRGLANHDEKLFALLAFRVWHATYLEGQSVQAV